LASAEEEGSSSRHPALGVEQKGNAAVAVVGDGGGNGHEEEEYSSLGVGEVEDHCYNGVVVAAAALVRGGDGGGDTPEEAIAADSFVVVGVGVVLGKKEPSC
jgi:hypothetical protein